MTMTTMMEENGAPALTFGPDDTRGPLFAAVKAALLPLLPPELGAVQRQNDAMEWTLEIGHREATEVDQMLVWIVGMMDEPVWGYDLEAESSVDRSWGWVKEGSLGLPEDADPMLVAHALLAAVLADLATLQGAEAPS